MFELKKYTANGELPKLVDDFADPFFEKLCPAVGMVLFKSAFPSGDPREMGYLSVWRGPEGIVVRVQDNENSMCWQVTGETFQGALKGVEKLLQEGRTGNASMKGRSPRKRGK